VPDKITAVDIEGKTFEVPVSELSWRPSAYGIVIKDDAVLLVRQFSTKHDLPGGGVDLGETPEEAVVREMKEETGLQVVNPTFIGFTSNFFTFSHAAHNTSQCLLFYYVCEFVHGEISTDGFGEWEKQYAQIAEWVPLGKLDAIVPASSIDFRDYIKKAAKRAV
jgi:mutator protein MutT